MGLALSTFFFFCATLSRASICDVWELAWGGLDWAPLRCARMCWAALGRAVRDWAGVGWTGPFWAHSAALGEAQLRPAELN